MTKRVAKRIIDGWAGAEWLQWETDHLVRRAIRVFHKRRMFGHRYLTDGSSCILGCAKHHDYLY